MVRAWLCGFAIVATGVGWTQPDEPRRMGDNAPRIVLGVGNELFSAGSEALRAGRYQDGIRLIKQGLERSGNTNLERSQALSNLCAAYAALGDADSAITHCTESLAASHSNWRAYSNRAYAYWLKGMYVEARFDIDAAAAITPGASVIEVIRGLINEATLRPRITTEDHQ